MSDFVSISNSFYACNLGSHRAGDGRGILSDLIYGIPERFIALRLYMLIYSEQEIHVLLGNGL